MRPQRLSTRIFASQALILILTLLLGCGLAVRAWRVGLDKDYERRALGVAQSVAADPAVARAVAKEDRSGVVQARAEAVRRATGTSFVVVTDRDGIRFSHPDVAQIGRHVSTDPGPALHGETVLAVETGTLGRSARRGAVSGLFRARGHADSARRAHPLRGRHLRRHHA